MLTPALSAAAAAIAAFIFGFPMRAAARRMNWLDQPSERKVHTNPVPFGGGVVLLIGTLGGMFCAQFAETGAGGMDPKTLAFAAGLTMSLMVGLWDDMRRLGPWSKIAMQSLIALFMWKAGFRIEILTNPFGETLQFGAEGAVFTVVWYVALMNAMNLIDGLDGLAVGVAAIAGVTILGVSASWSQPSAALLAAILVGSCVGFLPHNFHPARMFLGDGGSLSLGFFLATISLETSTKSPALLALLIPMVALLLPLADAAFAFVRRLAGGKHPFHPDRRHLHHRMLRAGLTPRRAVVIFYYLSTVNGVMAYLLAKSSQLAVLCVFLMLGLGFLLLIENLSSIEKSNNADNRDADE
jgi:UDP-GlcNAc:undecaprenyl-phosphate GlcNAc-1-phosphate transferase